VEGASLEDSADMSSLAGKFEEQRQYTLAVREFCADGLQKLEDTTAKCIEAVESFVERTNEKVETDSRTIKEKIEDVERGVKEEMLRLRVEVSSHPTVGEEDIRDDASVGSRGSVGRAGDRGRGPGDLASLRREMERFTKRQGDAIARLLTEVSKLRDSQKDAPKLTAQVDLLSHEIKELGKGANSLTSGVVTLGKIVGVHPDALASEASGEWTQIARSLAWRFDRTWTQQMRSCGQPEASLLTLVLGGVELPTLVPRQEFESIETHSPRRPEIESYAPYPPLPPESSTGSESGQPRERERCPLNRRLLQVQSQQPDYSYREPSAPSDRPPSPSTRGGGRLRFVR